MWSSDYELEQGEWFGEWLHKEIAANIHIEQQRFMPDRQPVTESVSSTQAVTSRQRVGSTQYLVPSPRRSASALFTATRAPRNCELRNCAVVSTQYRAAVVPVKSGDDWRRGLRYSRLRTAHALTTRDCLC